MQWEEWEEVCVCVCRCIDTVGKSILQPFDMFRIDMDRYSVTPAAFFLSELFQAAWISAEHLKTLRWNETEALEQIYVWELKISFYSNADFDQGRSQILENVIFPSKCIPVLYLYSY